MHAVKQEGKDVNMNCGTCSAGKVLRFEENPLINMKIAAENNIHKIPT